MKGQRDQSDMHKIGELNLLTKDQIKDESDLARPIRSVGPTAQWTQYEEERLGLALAKYIYLRPIPWLLVAKEFHWKPLDEVFKRIHNFLQDLQGELLCQAAHISANRNPNRNPSRNPGRNPNPAVEEEKRAAGKRSVRPWSEEEKEMFAKGIEAYGWGSWKLISADFVPTRMPNQLASHAQSLKKRKYDDVGGWTWSESPASAEESSC